MPTSFGDNSQVFTVNGYFTVPTGVTSVIVECWGAGGKGGTAVGVVGGTKKAAGGGGGGGAYARSTLSVTPGSSYQVVVGGSSSLTNKKSWFDSDTTVMAVGGEDGESVTEQSGYDILGIGGAGGAAGACIGDVVYSGGDGSGFIAGHVPCLYGTYSGAGGGGAGNSGDGSNAICPTSTFPNKGLGGSAFGGDGANGVTTGNSGNSGLIYGGGGSGGHTRDITIGQRKGGVGAQGAVIVWWDNPVGPPTTITACTVCSPIVIGCYLYINSPKAGEFPAPSGYYYNGSGCYTVVDGYVTNVQTYYYYHATGYYKDCNIRTAVGAVTLRSVNALSDWVCGDDGFPYEIVGVAGGPSYDINVTSASVYGSCNTTACYVP